MKIWKQENNTSVFITYENPCHSDKFNTQGLAFFNKFASEIPVCWIIVSHLRVFVKFELRADKLVRDNGKSGSCQQPCQF